MLGRVGLLALAALLVATPVALAVQAEGSLSVRGACHLPAASEAGGALLGVAANETANLTRLELTSPLVHVERHEWRAREVVVLDRHFTNTAEHTVQTFTLHDVRLRLVAGNHSGQLLLAPGVGPANASWSGPMQALAAEPRRLGDASVSTTDDDARHPHVAIDAAHVEISSTGLRATGDAVLTLFGPDVAIDAAENSTAAPTGLTQEATAPVGERVEVALVLRGAFQLALSGAPLTSAAPRVVAQARGVVAMDAAQGRLASAAGVLQADGAPTTLEGSLSLDLAPGAAGALDAAIQGDVAPASLLHVAGPPGVPVWPFVAVLVGAVAAGSGVLALRSVQRRRHPPEDLVVLAENALDERRYDVALEHLDAAARAAPQSVRVHLLRAHALSEMGRSDDALRAYESILARRQEPMALLGSTILLAELGRVAEARQRALRMLREQPLLVLELDHPSLAEVAAAEDVKRGVRRAKQELGDPG